MGRDLIEERAQKAKDDFGFEKYTLDYHDILNDSSINAVCIFTKIEMRDALHRRPPRAAIFSQKPAHNIEEGRKIIRAVDEAGVKLTPSFMQLYGRLHRQRAGSWKGRSARSATSACATPPKSVRFRARLRRLYDGHRLPRDGPDPHSGGVLY
ncbi:MAG: hypothetical protein ACLRRT_13070 [Ruthenibacterium lactatiformans]